ncbi:MAG: hypothetical protein RLY71_3933 [Pseudomonadota bacterium]|jgi:hypothetical protein
MPNLRVLSASILLALGLTACGGSPQDSSSGVLVDDLIADATVFCDSNGNGVFDSDKEASTITDDSGTYTFSPACTAQVATVAGTGYDKTSLKSPKGKYRAKARTRGPGIPPIASEVLSPFTTMQLESGLSDAEFQAVLVKLGLGNIDPATFDPTKDASRATTAAAIAKILNNIAEIISAAGGDPAAAFQAAAIKLATYLQTHPLNGSVFDNELELGDLVEAAAAAGFAAGNKDESSNPIWTDKARGNAAKLAREGITVIARNIRNHQHIENARDDFNNDAVSSIISETDLDDDDNVSTAKERCKDDNNIRRAQYVYTDGDGFTLVGPGTTTQNFTLQQLDAGLTLTGQKLGNFTQLQLPLRATELVLPRKGLRIALGLQVEEINGERLLQATIGDVLLKRDANGVVSASMSSKSDLFFYARSESGIEIGTGKTAFVDLDTTLLTSSVSGVGINVQKLLNGMKGRFPSNIALIDSMLNATGSYKLRLVVNELDLRHADGSRFSTGNISVKVPGKSRQTADRISGAAVLGRVTF